jgi:2-dehydrotetronate isomerase
MPHFAANLSFMFNEVPFLERFEAAAKAGFTAVEFLFPYEWPVAEVLNAPKGRTSVATGETRGSDLCGFAPEG